MGGPFNRAARFTLYFPCIMTIEQGAAIIELLGAIVDVLSLSCGFLASVVFCLAFARSLF